MSRLINLRSPYFVKATAPDDQTLTSAQLDLYVWKGTLSDQPTSPDYSLQKSTEDSDKDYVVFEISELCRDEIDYSFTGASRDTEPVYINWELTHTYEDGTTAEYSDILFGVDGYIAHGEALQVSENLFEAPIVLNETDEAEAITITIEDSYTGEEDRDFESGANIEITADYTPSNATLQWFKDAEEISGETAATLNISNAGSTDAGEYFCRAYLNEDQDDETSEDSNIIEYTLETCPEILFTNGNGKLTQKNYTIFNGAQGDSKTIKVQYGTDCYTGVGGGNIALADVKLKLGDGSSFTIDGVTTADVGGLKETSIVIETRRKNGGAPKRDILQVTYKDITKNREITQELNLEQVSSTGVITGIKFEKTSIDSTEQDVEITVFGDIGAEFDLTVIPIVDDTDKDGVITDEADYNWIDNSALNAVTGEISETGETKFTLSVPENTSDPSVERVVDVLARNRAYPANFKRTYESLVQSVVSPFAYLIGTEIEFSNADSEMMDVTYYSNVDVELRITNGIDGFRIVNDAPTDLDSDSIFDIDKDVTTATFPANTTGGTVTIKALENDGIERNGELSIRINGHKTWLDRVLLTQPGTSEFMIFQTIIDGPGNRTGVTTKQVGYKASGGGSPYILVVNSSVAWQIDPPSNVKLQSNIIDTRGFGQVYKGKPGVTYVVLSFQADNGDSDSTVDLVLESLENDSPDDVTLTITRKGKPNLGAENGPETNGVKVYNASRTTTDDPWVIDKSVELDASNLNVVGDTLTGYALVAQISDEDSGELRVEWFLSILGNKNNSNPINTPDFIVNDDHTNDALIITPTRADTIRRWYLVENVDTSYATESDIFATTVVFNDGTIDDWASTDFPEKVDPITKKVYYAPDPKGDTFVVTIDEDVDFKWWGGVTGGGSANISLDGFTSGDGTYSLGIDTLAARQVSGTGNIEITMKKNVTDNNNNFSLTIQTSDSGYVPFYSYQLQQKPLPVNTNTNTSSNSNSSNVDVNNNHNQGEDVVEDKDISEVISDVHNHLSNLQDLYNLNTDDNDQEDVNEGFGGNLKPVDDEQDLADFIEEQEAVKDFVDELLSNPANDDAVLVTHEEQQQNIKDLFELQESLNEGTLPLLNQPKVSSSTDSDTPKPDTSTPDPYDENPFGGDLF